LGLRIEFRPSLTLYVNGVPVIDEVVARLLYLIDRLGSILAASRSLGIPYARAWEYLSRIEETIGERIVVRYRGGSSGGGSALTSTGRMLLNKYLIEYRRLFRRDLMETVGGEVSRGDVLVYAGSNDIVFEHIAGLLRREYGVETDLNWIGSLHGLSSLLLGETDLAGIHVLDPETGEYNISFLKKYYSGEGLAVIEGYMRRQGFLVQDEMGFDDVIDGLLDGRLRLVNRNPGSGTRILLDHILSREAIRRGLAYDRVKQSIKGYDDIVYTHREIAEKIVRGVADVGVAVEWFARTYNLYFIPVAWERFDFVTREKYLGRECIRRFIEILRGCGTIDLLRKFNYRPSENIGRVHIIP